MLQPKRTKHRKMFKGRMTGTAHTGCHVSFGDLALQATECGRISSRQIEAARMAIMRTVKRQGKLYIRIFPDKPITKKPAETRQGTGKGNVEYYVAVVKPGRVLYEMGGLDQKTATAAFKLAQAKLPVMTRILTRAEQSL